MLSSSSALLRASVVSQTAAWRQLDRRITALLHQQNDLVRRLDLLDKVAEYDCKMNPSYVGRG